MILDDVVPHITGFFFRKCASDWRIWESQVNDHELTYIVKGKARFTINGLKHELEGGDLLYLTEGDIQEAVTYPQHLMQCYTVNFIPRYLTSKKTGAGGGDAGGNLFPMINHVGLKRDLTGMFSELTLNWNERQQGYVLKSRALFMLILYRLSEIISGDTALAHGDYRINRVTRYIALHYAEKLTVKALARQVNLDEVYFGQLFKRDTGMTVHQYMTKVRVHNAENLLQSGGYKIHQAAEMCGFSDIFHFYKSFKALRGFAPSQCIPVN